ncbi:hypothetical protein CRYUN_Cryun05aG0232000 [Craigia yunnanensis]
MLYQNVFSNCSVMQHLGVEEKPILKIPHLEAASILLGGPTLMKFTDRVEILIDLSRDELALAKHYPAHTAFVHKGWLGVYPSGACSSSNRKGTKMKLGLGTFYVILTFYIRWTQHFDSCLSNGKIIFLLVICLKEASIDKPFEKDACCCDIVFVQESH